MSAEAAPAADHAWGEPAPLLGLRAAELTHRTRLSPEPDHPLLDRCSEAPPDSFPTATGGSIFLGTSLSPGAVAGGAAQGRLPARRQEDRGPGRTERKVSSLKTPGETRRWRGGRVTVIMPGSSKNRLASSDYPAESPEGRGPPSSSFSLDRAQHPCVQGVSGEDVMRRGHSGVVCDTKDLCPPAEHGEPGQRGLSGPTGALLHRVYKQRRMFRHNVFYLVDAPRQTRRESES